jgi:hypothetical protein
VSVRRRVLPFVTTLSAVAVLAAGCGFSEEGPEPRVVAELAGETLTMEQVDEAVEEYCALRAVHPQAVATSRAGIRAEFVLGWAQAVAVEKLAPKYDVALPPEAIDRAAVEEGWSELGEINEDNYEAFEFLTWIQERLTVPVESLGSRKLEQEGKGKVGEPAVDRGIELIAEWLEENEPRLNPVFGELDEETGRFHGDPLSVPVSDEATAAASPELSEEQIAELPADQRCGPAAAAPAQEPPA